MRQTNEEGFATPPLPEPAMIEHVRAMMQPTQQDVSQQVGEQVREQVQATARAQSQYDEIWSADDLAAVAELREREAPQMSAADVEAQFDIFTSRVLEAYDQNLIRDRQGMIEQVRVVMERTKQDLIRQVEERMQAMEARVQHTFDEMQAAEDRYRVARAERIERDAWLRQGCCSNIRIKNLLYMLVGLLALALLALAAPRRTDGFQILSLDRPRKVTTLIHSGDSPNNFGVSVIHSSRNL